MSDHNARDASDNSSDDITMNVDVDLQSNDDERGSRNDEKEDEVVPMPASGGIETLREKLHAQMAQLRRGGTAKVVSTGEVRGRDKLLEERGRQRPALQERRRRETKEKIRREEEMKRKESKDKDKDKKESRDKGNPASVTICAF